jgi:HD-GYP domain-containing protein (c-di-GMP phosphodiesterase class II)
MNGERVRLAELVGSLSLATDVAAGLGMETALRTCLLAVQLGQELGVRGEPLRDIYYTGLLRFVGCTAFSHEAAWQYGAGDDMGLLRAFTPADTADKRDLLKRTLAEAGKGAPLPRRVSAVAHILSDPKFGQKIAVSHCDQAVALAGRMGMSAAVSESLGQIYERYDGKGAPRGLRGEQIALPARMMHVAWRAEVQRALEGEAEALSVVEQRAGGELDPQIAAAFLRRGRELLAGVAAASVWDGFLAAEPAPMARIEPARLGAVAEAFAHFVDLKSPYTLGHSTGVAWLAEAAGGEAGLSAEERGSLRVAALLHDLGRVSVPNGIWDKPARLNSAEWERVRLHAYQTERILSQTPLLAPYAQVAGMHHERADGSGYHRGVGGTTLSRSARLLAAADAYQAMTEARAYRPARSPEVAARVLSEEARAGKLDREAVECVLAAAGHRSAARIRGEWPASLSEREVEVLCLLARGLSNKQIAAELTISPRTAQHHVEHIYQKTGVSTRAAAALFAVENDLLS